VTWTKATGCLLIASPILIQVPYSMLITSFEYPAILGMPPATILERHAAASTHGPLTAIWCAFAMAILPLLLAICMLPAALSDYSQTRLLRAVTPLGVTSALVQMVGLLRWVALVPLLSRAWVVASDTPGAQTTIELVFRVHHQMFGVLLGELLGQLLLGLWTVGVALGLPASSRSARWQRPFGLGAGALFIAGSAASLRPIFPALSLIEPLSTFAFLMWSVWCCLVGVVLIRIPAQARPSVTGR
jgi:hypothetical protein